ncbi:MAG: recombinase family protein [Deltaproteobacteria bacterium]|nr:recombinase family protein [Deltaproteobacteria bacterium]
MRRQEVTERRAERAPSVRCASYVRTATTDESSITRQREETGALVRMHAADGWVLVAPPYEDVGVSGREADRPGLMQLLGDVEAGCIDVVIAADVARLGRSARLVGEILARFAARGVAVVHPLSG